MSDTLTQRLLAAVLDDQALDDDLVRDLALSSDGHGELVRLAAVLARLPGKGARSAELRLDDLLDDVALVAASESRTPPAGVDAMPGVEVARAPRAGRRIRNAGRFAMVGAIGAAAVVLLVVWSRHHAGVRDAKPTVSLNLPPPMMPPPPAVMMPPAPPPPAVVEAEVPAEQAARAEARALRADQAPSIEPPVIGPALMDVAIRVTPATATISIDGVTVARSPFFGRHPRDEALHRIVATASGYRSKSLVVAFDRSVTLDLSLERADLVAGNVSGVPVRTLVPGTARSRESPEWRAREPQKPFAEPPATQAAPPTVVSARPSEVPAQTPNPPALAIKGVVGWVVITTNVRHGEILVDDVVVGSTARVQPLVVAAGQHKLTVTAEGFAPATRFIDVPAAGTVRFELSLGSDGRGISVDAAGGSRPVRPIDRDDPYRYMLDAP